MSALVTTKTSVPGVELVYLHDRDLAGINIRGLARMLDCQPTTIVNVIKGVNLTEVEELEILTNGGVQGVNFIFEVGVIKILKAIRHSKRIDDVTRQNAEILYDRFAEAGFRLFTMMNTAPDVLKEKIDKTSVIQQPIESQVSPELADRFLKTEWVIRKSLELGIPADEVQRLLMNFDCSPAPATATSDRPVTPKTPKPSKTPSNPAQPIVNNNSGSDIIRQFVDENIIPADVNTFLTKSDAYDRYYAWCCDRGIRAKGYPAFCASLNALFPSHVMRRTSRMVKGKRVPVPEMFCSLTLTPKQ